jgi:transmembrane sensor
MTAQDPSPTNGSSPPPGWEDLARYLAGEAPPAEAAAVARWLDEDRRRAELLSSLQAPVERLRAAPPAGLDVEGALRRVHARMEAPGLTVVPGTSPARARWLGATWGLRAAAAVAILAGGALIARQLLRPAGGVSQVAAAARVYRTAVGQRDSVRLPDGTRVLLGPGSELALAGNFQASRSVSLSGEALFDVRHDAARPFTVRSGGAVIQDLGTQFDVRGGSGEGARVLVIRGSVSVRAAASTAEAVVLRAGDVARLEADGRLAAERVPDADGELAWTRGELVFRGAPVAEVAAAVRRWYGVELRIADPALAGRHLTTSFASDSRERVLHVIALALGARVELRGDTATLTSSDSGGR